LNSWWVRARSRLILKYFKEHHISSLLEIGSGNGYVSIPLSAAGVNVIGVEPLRMGALTLTRDRVPTIQATFEDLKLERNSCPAIGAFDVVEHIKDDQGFVTSVFECLVDGGFFIATVPAHQQLYSDYDTALGHYRRYSRGSLDSLILGVGFTKVTSRYFFSSLVFPAFFMRRIPFLLGRRRVFDGKGGVSEDCESIMHVPHFLNRLLSGILVLDTLFRLPFGLSVFGIYRKTSAT